MSCILQVFLSHNKFLSFWPSVTRFTTPCHLLYSTRLFDTNSNSNVDNIKNISLHEDVFASLYRNVDNKLPRVTASHLISNDTECSWSHRRCNWRSWGTNELKGTETKILKEYLKMNIYGMIILKWILRNLVLFIDLILHYNAR